MEVGGLFEVNKRGGLCSLCYQELVVDEFYESSNYRHSLLLPVDGRDDCAFQLDVFV